MPHLLELFCGTKSIGNMCEAAGWRVTSLDIELGCNPTILRDALNQKPPRKFQLSDKLFQVGIDMAEHFCCPLFMESPQSMLEHRDVVKELRMCLIDHCKYEDDRWHQILP